MKILGYVLAIVGVLGLALAMVPELGSQVSLPEELDETTLTIVSLIIAAIGIFFITRGGGGKRGKVKEVPIFQGKDVVGYRRTKK